MKATGQILKEAREKRGASIAEVSLATKINTRVISAMEEGNMAKLPPKTFLRGFVQSYASFLQLDPDEIMARYQAEVGSAKPESSLIPEKEDATTDNAKPPRLDPIAPNNFAKVAAVIGIFILIGLIVLLKNKMENYQHESIPPVAALPTPTPTPSASPTSDPSGALVADTMAPMSNAAITAPTASPVVVMTTATTTTTATPTPKSSPELSPAPTTTPIMKPVPAPTQAPTPKPSPTATPVPKGRPQDVVLEALDTVSIDAQIDDEPVKKIQLKPDQVENIKAKRKVILKLSDGGAVNIIVNGTDRGVPGDLGKPKKVEIP